MRILVLSKRHRAGSGYCIVCDRHRQNRAPLLVQVGDGKNIEVHICAACLREAERVATENKKAER